MKILNSKFFNSVKLGKGEFLFITSEQASFNLTESYLEINDKHSDAQVIVPHGNVVFITVDKSVAKTKKVK